MDRTKLLRPLVFLMLFMYFADMVADKFYWYYTLWWFDILMHFLGGLWEGILFIWFFSQAQMPFLRRPITDLGRQSIYYVLLFVMFIGLSWEAGEFFTNNLIGRESFVISDTIYDLILDFIGGLAAVLYCKYKIMPVRKNNVQLS